MDELASLAESAESIGLSAIFASHHYNNRDEFLALAAMAEATDEIRLGPGITNPYETHPVTLASRMATLDELADGRGLFGIGAGDRSTLTNLGYDHDQALARVLETMQVARRLWAGDRLDHDGTFDARSVALNYDAGEIPIYVGTQGPHMTQMAATHADGVLYNGSHPRDVRWAADRVEAGLGNRQDGVDTFDFAVYASVSIAEEANQAREAARPPVAFIAAGAPQPVLSRHGLDKSRAETIGESIAAGDFSTAFDEVTPAMIDVFSIAGTPDDVGERIEQLLEVADSIVFGSPLGPDQQTAIELMGEILRSDRV